MCEIENSSLSLNPGFQPTSRSDQFYAAIPPLIRKQNNIEYYFS